MRGYPFCLIIFSMIVALFSSTHANAQSGNNCKNLEDLSVETALEQRQGKSYDLILKFDDNSLGDYAIVLNGPDKESKVLKNKQKKFDDLKPGQYTIYIIDKKGCSKQVNVNIK